jgi:hypothetical protein
LTLTSAEAILLELKEILMRQVRAVVLFLVASFAVFGGSAFAELGTVPAPTSLPQAAVASSADVPETIFLTTCSFYIYCQCGTLLVQNACFVNFYCQGNVLYCNGRPLTCPRGCTQIGPP